MLPFLSLTKPRISLLFAITGLAAIITEGSLLSDPLAACIVVIATFLTGGSANAFNQYFEREIDKQMGRTVRRRPLPQGKITPASALIFSISICIIGTLLLWVFGTPLAAYFGLGTILFYSFFYTLWLKPRTPYNIVIGGVAGATGPLIGWAAATGTVGWIPFIMFLIIFFWTPPHFWALALYHKDDYKAVKLPMLPLVAGDEHTRKQILFYSLSLIPLSLSLYFMNVFQWLYGVSAFLLSLYFVWKAYGVYQKKTVNSYRQLFHFSIGYLMILFLIMIVDIVTLA